MGFTVSFWRFGIVIPLFLSLSNCLLYMGINHLAYVHIFTTSLQLYGLVVGISLCRPIFIWGVGVWCRYVGRASV